MDPFDTLGLAPDFELDVGTLEARYRDLQKALHPDKHVNAPPAERRAALARAVNVNEAYRALKDELKRAEALLARHGGKVSEEDAGASDPEFLMEVMELREALAEARAEQDLDAVGKLGARVAEHAKQTRQTLLAAFRALAEGQGADLEQAAAQVGRMRYYRRFQDEVDRIEEDALS